eukprot:1724041-Pleurochrysis_carterae.AAC.3
MSWSRSTRARSCDRRPRPARRVRRRSTARGEARRGEGREAKGSATKATNRSGQRQAERRGARTAVKRCSSAGACNDMNSRCSPTLQAQLYFVCREDADSAGRDGHTKGEATQAGCSCADKAIVSNAAAGFRISRQLASVAGHEMGERPSNENGRSFPSVPCFNHHRNPNQRFVERTNAQRNNNSETFFKNDSRSGRPCSAVRGGAGPAWP